MSIMIKLVRDLLRSYWIEHASNKIKNQRPKLLIYDEYLQRYVSADELLIPGVKVKSKGAVTCKKSKELFVFDVLFKKFVNPRLDLLVPGIKSLDHLIKFDTHNKYKKDIQTISRDFFWGKKTGKKHAVLPLPPVHTENHTETEPPQLGWAGQKTRNPDTDPRPENGKIECQLGPGKDPKKKKPPKKKSKKNKYLSCNKVQKLVNDTNDGISKMDAKQTTKNSQKESKSIIMYNEENCYSDSKDKEKQRRSQDTTNSLPKSPLVMEIDVKQKTILKKRIQESEKNRTNNSGMPETVCSKLFTNKVGLNVKEATMREKDNKGSLKGCDVKNVTKNDRGLKSNQSDSLLCNNCRGSSLIPIEKSDTTNLYLCKEKQTSEIKLGITEKMSRKSICPPEHEVRNEIKCNKVESLHSRKEESGRDQTDISYCSKKTQIDDCSRRNSINDSSLDKTKYECKQTISKRQNVSSTEIHNSSKEKEQTASNNLLSDAKKSKPFPYNFMERPKTAYLPNSCMNSSLRTSGQSKKYCNGNKEKVVEVKNKSDNNNDNSSECKKVAERSKAVEKCKETNVTDKQKLLESTGSRCLNIDPKFTERLQCITQEQMFKRAESSTDLSTCSSYLGFKIKQAKPKPTTQNNHKDHKHDGKRTPNKEGHGKTKKRSKTTSKSYDDSIQSKIKCESLRGSKSESVLSKEPQNQILNNSSQDIKALSAKPTFTDATSLSSNKKEFMSNTGCGSDAKGNLQKHTLTEKHSLTKEKLSMKCNSKSILDIEANKPKSKKVGKNKNIKHTINNKNGKKEPKEKSSLCNKHFISSEHKDLEENTKNNTGKDRSCCKNVINQIARCQEKPVVIKTNEKDIDECSREKSPTHQPVSDKETLKCPTADEKPKEKTTDKSHIGEHTYKETNESKLKDKTKGYIKHVITGATQRKKTNRCTKIKFFQCVKSKGSSNKSDKSNVKSTSPKKLQQNEEPVDKLNNSKSAKVCSEKTSSWPISIDKNSKKSKSKQSICLKKTSHGNIQEPIKKKSKSQKGDSLTKLNKLVRKAKCSTASRNIKQETVTHALVCSKSTPNIQQVKHSKVSGISKTNGAMTKKYSTSNPPVNKSNSSIVSKTKLKNTKMCSLHFLQKKMTETPVKTSKRIDSKSFSGMNTNKSCPRKDTSAELLSSSNCSPQPNLEWNKQKTEATNVKGDRLVTEEQQPEIVEPKSELNYCLKIPNWGKNAWINSKHNKLTPSFTGDKYFKLLLTSLSEETKIHKHKPKNVKNLDTIASKNDNRENLSTEIIRGRNGPSTSLGNSLNKIKQCILNVSKDNTVNKYNKIKNTKKTMNIHTENSRPNRKEINNLNKIKNEGFPENYKFKGGNEVLNGNMMSSSLKGITHKSFLKEGDCKGEVSKSQPYQAILSKAQHKAKDALNADTKSVKQIVRTRSAASPKNTKNALSIPHDTLSSCKTKSLSSFNAFKLCDTDANHVIRPFQSLEKETNTNLKTSTIDGKNSQSKERILVESLFSSQNKTLNTSRLQRSKYKKACNSSVHRIAQVCGKSSVGHDLVLPIKLQNLPVTEPKPIIETKGSIAQTNERKNNDSFGKVRQDLIKGLFDISVEKCNQNYTQTGTNCIINQHGHLISQIEVQNIAKENKVQNCLTVPNNLKPNNLHKKEPNTAITDLTNLALTIKTPEKQVLKLENIVPSVNAVPICFRSSVSAGSENLEFNENVLGMNTKFKDKNCENKINKEKETEHKVGNENTNISCRRLSVIDKVACDSQTLNVYNTLIAPSSTDKLQNKAILKYLSTSSRPSLQNYKFKPNDNFKQPKLSKTSVEIKYSPKSKTKMQLISKVHKKFTNYKKTPLTADKIDSGSHDKLKETTKTPPNVLNEYINREQQNNSTHLNKATSLSSKQTRLLMEQPFLKKPNSVPSSEHLLHTSKPETSFVASNKYNSTDISSPLKLPTIEKRVSMEQPIHKNPKSEPSSERLSPISKPDTSLVASNKDSTIGILSPKFQISLAARELKMLMEQPFYKKSKVIPSIKNSLCNSKSEYNLREPQLFTEYELHRSKSENNLVVPNKKNMICISPRKQYSSIRSQLQQKIPMKAVIQQVNLNKTEKDS